MVILSSDQEWDGGLVEAAALSVPLFDAVEGGFAREVEHEEDGNCVVADEGQHVDEFALSAKIPDAEGDFGVADANRLLHEIHACATLLVLVTQWHVLGGCYTQCLDVVFVPAALDVFDHQAGLADLSVSHHAYFDHHARVLLCLLPLPVLAVLRLALR